ncbi:VanW family protein [Clostridium sediminicola]|uniref:VanW family protein n=1 Tax=Clostridium sediminicola TaxID=3114879 RepID=UPI0031F201F9
MELKKKKLIDPKKNLIITVLSIAFISSLIIGYIYSEVRKWDGLMMPNIIIEGIDFTGKTREETISKLHRTFGNLVLEKEVEILALEKKYSISFRELDVEYNIIEIVDKAYEYCRELNFFQKYLLIKKGVNKEFYLSFTYNKEAIKETITKMQKDIDKEAINATIKYQKNGGFKVEDDIKGVKLVSEKLISNINEKIQSEAENLTLIAPIKEINAEITGDDLRTVNANVGSYATSFVNSSYNRGTNIVLATEAINGTVLMPEEIFSFNETVGARTDAKGYKRAHIILNGKYVDGLGGGICQVSSTLYNAALLAGLEIIERHHHTYPSNYVPIGQDATVDYGNLDIKFRNNEEYPIYIYGYTKNNIANFIIYSNNELNKTIETVVNDVYKTYPPTYKIIEDPYLPVGIERVEKEGRIGYRVNVYRTVYENGVKILTETVSSDYFMPFQGVKRVGTKVN